jgi:hypothetical protein
MPHKPTHAVTPMHAIGVTLLVMGMLLLFLVTPWAGCPLLGVACALLR